MPPVSSASAMSLLAMAAATRASVKTGTNTIAKSWLACVSSSSHHHSSSWLCLRGYTSKATAKPPAKPASKSPAKPPAKSAPGIATDPVYSYFSTRDAKFMFTALESKHYEHLKIPEFTFAGRSNVGKSTLISAVLRSRGLVKTSKKPGHTSALNFFALTSKAFPDKPITIVDMPGYGFRSRDEWGVFITKYLAKRKELKRVFLLVEAKVGELKHTDLSFLELVEQYNIPTQLVLTKTDKLRHSAIKLIATKVHNSANMAAPTVICPDVIACSCKTMGGIDEIQAEMLRDIGVLPSTPDN
ncbi:hypothetical protein GGI07_000065 [Coemansia sp. Benny D115]|nr:hypothetical protein GGI07_000065 [Coemansia sp. Benny D115]